MIPHAPIIQNILNNMCPPRKPANEIELEIDGATVTVQYDFQPAEREVRDLDSPMVGPGCAAEVDITDVRITGDATDLLSPAVLSYIENKILAARGE